MPKMPIKVSSDVFGAISDVDGCQIKKQKTEKFFKFLRKHPDARAPERKTPGSAGRDLYSVECVKIGPGDRKLVSTGLILEIPSGCYGRVAGRSGLTFKNGIVVEAGVIDSDYRGIVYALLFNLSKDEYVVNVGDRVAQLIIEKIVDADFEEVENVGETERGDSGFGSTGVGCEEKEKEDTPVENKGEDLRSTD